VSEMDDVLTSDEARTPTSRSTAGSLASEISALFVMVKCSGRGRHYMPYAAYLPPNGTIRSALKKSLVTEETAL
jgi:hypothetical protein